MQKVRTLPHAISPVPLAAALAAMVLGAPLAAQAVGVTSVVRNNVEVSSIARPALHKAAVRETLGIGNDIVTGANSMTQLLLLDRTSFTVGANGRVRIDRFVFDPQANQSAVSASVAKGAFRFMSSTALHKGKQSSSIRTPVATIGIRGTIVEGVVGADAIRVARSEIAIDKSIIGDPDTATLIVLRGPGRNARGVRPGAIDVEVGEAVIAIEEAGMALFIPGTGQQPVGPFRLSNRGTTAMRDLLGPRPLPGGNPGWERDPITDHEMECSIGGQFRAAGCPVPD